MNLNIFNNFFTVRRHRDDDGAYLPLSREEKIIQSALNIFFSQTDIVRALDQNNVHLYLPYAHSGAFFDLLISQIYFKTHLDLDYKLATNLNELFAKINFERLNEIFGPDGENNVEWNKLYDELRKKNFKMADKPKLISQFINFFVEIYYPIPIGDGMTKIDYVYGEYFSPSHYLIEIDPRFEEGLYLHGYLNK